MNFSVNNNNTPAPANRNAPVQGAAPTTPTKVKVIDAADVQAYSAEEQALFDELSSGMPPPGYSPARSSPDLKGGLDELEKLIESAANEPQSTSMASFDTVMAKVKLLMLKNRESELSLRDQMRVQVYDLKLQGIEKDKEAANAAFKSALINGAMGMASAGINLYGGTKQMSLATKALLPAKGLEKGAEATTASLKASYAQGVGMKFSGAAQGASSSGAMAASFADKEVAEKRAEGDKLRAMADSVSQLMNQASDRAAIAREVMMDIISTQKSANEAITQALNKRLAV